jgi:hypothetical protein
LQSRDGALPGESNIPLAVVKRLAEKHWECLAGETLICEQNKGMCIPLSKRRLQLTFVRQRKRGARIGFVVQ